MKHPQPDIGDILKASFINDMGSARKFKRLWGTTTVDGIEVLCKRQYYYPSNARSANFEKLFRMLGAYNDVVDADPKGISSAWIYLNKGKGGSLPNNYRHYVADNLRTLWWDDADGPMPENLTLTTSIVIEAQISTTGVTTTPRLNTSWPKERLIAAIIDNYDTLWDTCVITQHGVGVINKGSFVNDVTKVETPDEDDLSANDPWLAAIARNAPRSVGVPFTIKDVSIGHATAENGTIYNTYVLDIEIPYISISNTSPIVQAIADSLLLDHTTPGKTVLSNNNDYWTYKEIVAMDSSDLEDDPAIITRPYRLWEDEVEQHDPRFSSIWYGDYVKADVFDNPRAYGVSYRELYGYILKCIDSGYRKKKVPWWKKVIAVVIVVVSVVLLQPQVGIAAAIVLTAMIVSLITLAFATAGSYEWATAFAEVNKAIEPLVIVASIYLIVTGMMNAYKSAQAAAEAAAAEAGAAATEVTISDVVQEYVKTIVTDFLDNLMTGATDLMAGDVTAASMQFMSKLVSLYTYPQKLKLESINDRNKDLQAEYDKLTNELNQENDALLGFARVYAKPATADWSMYAATFDHPYERGGGPLALGNIQRTTKQAIRKASYNDPIFENIMGV